MRAADRNGTTCLDCRNFALSFALWALIGVLLLVLQGCGGGGDAGPPPYCTGAPLRVQLYGDSTMVGVDPLLGFKPGPNNPGAALQRAMDTRFGAGVVAVQNMAVSGSSSVELLSGFDLVCNCFARPPWPMDVAADLVVMNHGINDAQRIGVEAYEANLRALASVGVPTIFETPNPGWGRPIEPDDYARAMRDVAGGLGLPLADAFAYVEAIDGWQSMVPDGIHPDDEAYGLIVRDVLAPAVGSAVAAQLRGCR